MSVRAYRVNKIDHEEADSFNLWHDTALVELLDSEDGIFESMAQGTGLIDVWKGTLRKAIRTLNLDPEIVASLKKDIKHSKDDSGYVTYYCF